MSERRKSLELVGYSMTSQLYAEGAYLGRVVQITAAYDEVQREWIVFDVFYPSLVAPSDQSAPLNETMTPHSGGGSSGGT